MKIAMLLMSFMMSFSIQVHAADAASSGIAPITIRVGQLISTLPDGWDLPDNDYRAMPNEL